MGANRLGNQNAPERLFARAEEIEIPTGDFDLLTDLYNRQSTFLKRIEESGRWGTRVEHLVYQVLMAQAELIELLNWLPWKKHKREYGRDISEAERQAAAEEVVDLFHFVLNMAILLGITPETLYKLYVAKNEINHARQDKGY